MGCRVEGDRREARQGAGCQTRSRGQEAGEAVRGDGAGGRGIDHQQAQAGDGHGGARVDEGSTGLQGAGRDERPKGKGAERTARGCQAGADRERGKSCGGGAMILLQIAGLRASLPPPDVATGNDVVGGTADFLSLFERAIAAGAETETSAAAPEVLTDVIGLPTAGERPAAPQPSPDAGGTSAGKVGFASRRAASAIAASRSAALDSVRTDSVAMSVSAPPPMRAPVSAMRSAISCSFRPSVPASSRPRVRPAMPAPPPGS